MGPPKIGTDKGRGDEERRSGLVGSAAAAIAVLLLLPFLLLHLLLQLLLLYQLRVWLCTFSSPRSRYLVMQWGESVMKLPAAAEKGGKRVSLLLRMHCFRSN
jgi:hypothetical protein